MNETAKSGRIEEMFMEYSNVSQKDVFSWFLNRGVPREIVTRLFQVWNFSYRVGEKLFKIGKLIVCRLVEFAIDNPNMLTGVAIGLGLSWFLSNIPVVGWLIGPLVAAIFALVLGYYGHLRDNPRGNALTMLGRGLDLFFDLIGITVNQIKEGEKNELKAK